MNLTDYCECGHNRKDHLKFKSSNWRYVQHWCKNELCNCKEFKKQKKMILLLLGYGVQLARILISIMLAYCFVKVLWGK